MTIPSKQCNRYFVHGPGVGNHLAAVFGDTLAGGEHYYYHVDGLGSVTAVTNGAGEELATNRYDSFGKLVAQTGSLPFASTYTYTGREWDAEAGLYYYRARYYDPSLGRFISEDPIGFAGGMNFYAYVENNPLKWVDPWGLDVTININRTTYTTNSIVGTVSVTSNVTTSTFSGYTLENRSPPDNADLPVPSGTYPASMRTDHTPNRVELTNVPNATNIQIHNANAPGELEGCFAAGTTTSADFVGNSVNAMNSINNIISADGSGNITVNVNGSATGP